MHKKASLRVEQVFADSLVEVDASAPENSRSDRQNLHCRSDSSFLIRDCCAPTPSLSFLPGPLDHGLWRAVQEDEFGVHFLLQVQLSCLPDQEDVCAQLEDAIHVGQLLEHDGVGNAAEKLSDKLANDQDHRGVKSHDPGGERWSAERL